LEFVFDPSKFDLQLPAGLNSTTSVLGCIKQRSPMRGAINLSKRETYLHDTVR